MTVLYAGKHRLRLRLSPEEMGMLQMSRDGRIDCGDPDTRAFLLALLEEARSQADFVPGRGRLLVEACPDGEAGGLITFTVSTDEAGGRGVAPVVFHFDDAESLIRGAVALYTQYRYRIRTSSLYVWEEGYRLVLSPLDYTDRLSTYLLSEYGRQVGEGEILAAFTDEHGRLIAAEDAVETLARYFSGGG